MELKERPEADEIDVRAALGVSLEIYRRHFWKLMLLALILVVPVEIMYLQQIDSAILGLVVEMIGFVTLTWFWAAPVMTVKPTSKAGGYSLSDLIAAVWPKLFWLVMLTAVTDVGGLLLRFRAADRSRALPERHLAGRRSGDAVRRTWRVPVAVPEHQADRRPSPEPRLDRDHHLGSPSWPKPVSGSCSRPTNPRWQLLASQLPNRCSIRSSRSSPG